MSERLVLVDLNDCRTGICEKLETHRKGLLHRAFSLFVFDGDMLLIQKRAAGKYHSGGLWANSCCSHPRDGEKLEDAIYRRLKEETGIDGESCRMREAGSFVYRAEFHGGMTEYEYDHVFIGEYHGEFSRNPEEAEEMKFVKVEEIAEDVEKNPSKYAPWFITALPIAIAGRKDGI